MSPDDNWFCLILTQNKNNECKVFNWSFKLWLVQLELLWQNGSMKQKKVCIKYRRTATAELFIIRSYNKLTILSTSSITEPLPPATDMMAPSRHETKFIISTGGMCRKIKQLGVGEFYIQLNLNICSKLWNDFLV